MFKSPKTDSGRTVDVPAELVPILEDHLAQYVGAEADALLFTSPRVIPCGRTKFRPRWAELSHGWSDGLALPRPARLRRNMGRGAGATLPELMHRLGHSTHTAALRYQHATSERHREIADRLGALLQRRP